ncbi:hypothetical protein [Nocardia brasiliensis]|uniref:hypothetical protein n=1 Tax=Nocardia brasiliensis TaxID=37326 RepID=UPI002457AE81|nr:hypothetical protein [Nocardia brasiliensis]
MSNNSPATTPDASNWEDWEGVTLEDGHALVTYRDGQVLVSVLGDDHGREAEVIVPLEAEEADELIGIIVSARTDCGDESAEDWEEWEGPVSEERGQVLVQYAARAARISATNADGLEAVLTLNAKALEALLEALEDAAGDPVD